MLKVLNDISVSNINEEGYEVTSDEVANEPALVQGNSWVNTNKQKRSN